MITNHPEKKLHVKGLKITTLYQCFGMPTLVPFVFTYLGSVGAIVITCSARTNYSK